MGFTGNRIRFRTLALLACLASNGSLAEESLGGSGYTADRVTRFALPQVLFEVSGLALKGDALYAHDDELGVIYQIDFGAGRVLKRFALEGAVRADFEGIAFIGERLFLTTSAGDIFETRIGAAESPVPYRRHEGDIDCEVEGLTADPAGGGLLLACKKLHNNRKDLVIHRWDLDTKRLDAKPAIRIRKKAWRRHFEAAGQPVPKELQLTALTMTPTGSYLAIAGPQRLLLELTGTGKLLATLPLDERSHRQPEGLALTHSGQLIVADEGDNKGSMRSPGLLSIYEPAS